MAPKTSLLYFLISCGLAVLVWLSLSSWRVTIDSYVVEGKVEALFGDPTFTQIRYTTDPHITDPRRLQAIDVQADGSYSCIINVPENSSVYFYAVKEGYSPARVQQFMHTTSSAIRIPTLRITSLFQKSYNHAADPATYPHLPIYYGQQCPDLTTTIDRLRLDQIQYFENLQKLLQCSTDPRSAVMKASLAVNGFRGGEVFFLLNRTPGGQFVINEQPVVMPPPTAPVMPASEASKKLLTAKGKN